MKNDGTGYELLTQEIFRLLMEQDDVKNIVVEHNVRLQGKSVSHQVDVYWEFEIGGIKYRTVVECKDWHSSSVEQGDLFAFKSKLEDLNYPIGIYVTRTGFQSGAIAYANEHGIILYQLAEESDHPPIELKAGNFARLKLRPKDWILEVTGYEVDKRNISFQVDSQWLDEIAHKFGDAIKKKLLAYKPKPAQLGQTHLFNDLNESYSTLFDVIQPFAVQMFDARRSGPESFSYTFTEPTYLKAEIEEVYFIRIGSVSFDIEIEEKPMFESPMKLKGFVGYVLKQVIKESTRRFLIRKT